MSSAQAMIPWDVRMQFRYGFYTVSAVLTVAYILTLSHVPDPWFVPTLIVVTVTDPGVLGFYFVAALVLFEKEEGVLDALVTSPLGVGGYLVSKVASLTALALLATTLIVLFAYGLRFDPVMFIVSVCLTSVFFILLGFVAVARFDSVNSYFLSASVSVSSSSYRCSTSSMYSHSLFYLLPLQASLVLLEAAFGSIPTWKLAYGVSYLTIGSAPAAVLARRAFERHVVAGTRRRERQPSPTRPVTGFGPVATLMVMDLRK